MPSWSELDLSTIDLRTLPAEQWEPLKAEVRRRAHAERSQVLRGILTRAGGWLRRREAQSYAPSHKRPLYFGGRI